MSPGMEGRTLGFRRVIVLIDGDNIHESHWPGIRRAVQSIGAAHRIIAAHNAAGRGWSSIEGVECETLPYKVANGVDFYLSVRLGEILSEDPDAIVIASNDGDFAAVFQALRHFWKLPGFSVTSAGLGHEELARAADLCITVPDAPKKPEKETHKASPHAPSPSKPAKPLPLVGEVLQSAILQLNPDGDWMSLKEVHDHLQANLIKWGDGTIRQVLQEYPAHFELDENLRRARLIAKPHRLALPGSPAPAITPPSPKAAQKAKAPPAPAAPPHAGG